MKIKFKKKRHYWNLTLSVIWLTLGIFSIIDNNQYSILIIGILYTSAYIYENVNQYITIEDDVLKKNKLFENKKIRISKIKTIKKFAGDYIIKTDKKELIINTQIIEPKSLTELTTFLKTLNAEWI